MKLNFFSRILLLFSMQSNDAPNQKAIVENSGDDKIPVCEYLTIFNHKDGSISLVFHIEKDEILGLGEEMNAIREEAYMNGYNWEAFLNYHLKQSAPEILEEMKTDSEAGAYIAYYDDGAKNKEKVNRFADIIHHLVENKEEIFRILREHGDDIEWD